MPPQAAAPLRLSFIRQTPDEPAAQTPPAPPLRLPFITQTPEPADDRSFLGKAMDVIVPGVARIGGAIGGGILGIPGGPVGIAAGGAAGAMVGDGLAQSYQVARGTRDAINPKLMLVEGALGAIPVVGKAGSVAATVARRAAQGAGLGAVGTAAGDAVEGQPFSWKNVALGGTIGAVVGAPLGAVEAKVAGRRAPAAPVTAPKTPAPAVETPPSPSAVVPPPSVDEIPHRSPLGDQPAPRTIAGMAEAEGAPLPPTRDIPDAKLVDDKMVARFPEDQREGLKAVLAEHDGFSSQRGEVVPWERTKAVASYLTVEAQALPKGTVLNDAEQLALANRLTKVNDDLAAITTKVQAGQANDWDLLKLAKLREDAVVLMGNHVATGAETGRALNARKILAAAEETKDQTLLRAALETLKPDDLKAFAAKWAALPDDVAKLRFVRESMAMTPWQKVMAVRYGNILSGVKTHLRNLIPTTINGAFRTAALAPAWGYDVARAATTKAPRTIFLSEIPDRLFAAPVGLKQGLKSAFETLKHGVAPSGVTGFDLPRPELRGGGANPWNWAGRALEAEDQLMYAIAYETAKVGRLKSLATSMGRSKGLKGADLDRYITAHVAEGMVDVPPQIKAAADKEAREILFREDPVRSVQWILDAKRRGGTLGKVFDFVMPFVKVPGNILAQGIENAPFGMYATQRGRAQMAAGGRESAEAVGRMALGGAALGTMALWAAEGKVSGQGPSNPTERAWLMAQGWRPNSVKIGDAWVDYTLMFQPIAPALTGIANLWERTEERRAKGESVDVVADATQLLASVVRAGLDQSFLTGVSDLNSVIEDPSRYAKHYAGRVGQSFVPGAGMARTVTSALDPVVREPQTGNPLEHARAITPGLSTTVAPKLDPFGRAVTRPGGPITRAASPIVLSPVTTDPVTKTLADLGIDLGAPVKELRDTVRSEGRRLSTAERQRIGQAVRDVAARVIAMPSWQRQRQRSPAAAKASLENAINRARTTTYAQIRGGR